MQKSITFLFSAAADRPMGGYKVVYEYANRLAADGYRVCIVYGIATRPLSSLLVRMGYKFLRFFRYLRFRFFGGWSGRGWFELDGRVKEILRYDLRQGFVPVSDFYVATAWSTAPWLAGYRGVGGDRRLYFIQSYESWATSDREVAATWHLPLHKIVIAPWLLDKAGELGVDADLIENGFDQDYFVLSSSISDRDPLSISMLYHHSPLKGCGDGMAALEIVRSRYPGLSVVFFGAEPREETIPKWINYIQRPGRTEHNALYNNSAIFVAPSHIEGFALTPAEAMLCGAVVCATDIGGYTVVCHDKRTALLCEVGDVEGMAENISRLIEDKQLRVKLAQNALENIKRYTWEAAYAKFAGLLRTLE